MRTVVVGALRVDERSAGRIAMRVRLRPLSIQDEADVGQRRLVSRIRSALGSRHLA